MRQGNRKKLKNPLTAGRLFTVLGLGFVGYSALYNIRYFTADMPTALDWYGAFGGAVLADLGKAALAVAIPGLWAGRKYILLVLALMVFGGASYMSLFAAHEVKLQQQLAVSVKKQQARKRRDGIIGRYKAAQKAVAALADIAPVQQVETQIAAALAQVKAVDKKVWGSSGQCWNATAAKSIRICKDVLALRSVLKQSRDKAQAARELEEAAMAVSVLPPLVEQTASRAQQELVAVIFALVLEIGSSLFLPLGQVDFGRDARRKSHRKAKETGNRPQEQDWIAAMQRAAKDQANTDIVFDKDGLMKASYKALAKEWDVKSSSTVGARMQRLKDLGYLEATGSQRNIRYRMLEAI